MAGPRTGDTATDTQHDARIATRRRIVYVYCVFTTYMQDTEPEHISGRRWPSLCKQCGDAHCERPVEATIVQSAHEHNRSSSQQITYALLLA